MEKKVKYLVRFPVIVLLLLSVILSKPHILSNSSYFPLPPDTIKSEELQYPFKDEEEYAKDSIDYNNPLYLKDPKNINTSVEYDPEKNEYILNQKIGDFEYRPPQYMSLDEYSDYDVDKALQDYWRQKADAKSLEKHGGLIPNIRIGGEAFDRIFGSSTIDIRPSGSAELIFGVNATRRDDPALDVRQRRTANFDFQEKIQMSVVAKIGDKIELKTNYNTEASFEFENKMNLRYEGKEDEIIKLIEAGDVTLPLPGSLITGCQSLFGIKTKLQFGKVFVTTVFSQQKSQTSTIEVSGGAQVSNFSIKADQYEENRHFFVGHFFREQYEDALKTLPLVSSSVNITKIEVWITNIGAATTENRNIIAFADLGENTQSFIHKSGVIANGMFYPTNEANDLYGKMSSHVRDITTVNPYMQAQGYVAGEDYESVELARKLGPNEYTFNSRLGFISINTSLNSDQVLAVAYQYKIIGDTNTYQVGEFSNGGINAPQSLMVKLLRSTSINTNIPMWDLMMKNVYSIGAYQVNSEDFRLNVLYASDEEGVPMGYLTEGLINGIPLIRVMGLDNLNTQLDDQPDGVFDFIDGAAINGGTIQPSNGRIFFPLLEPFGEDLKEAIGDTVIAAKYCYDELYSMTKSGAQQHPDKNKFMLEGMYKSTTGSDISLNAMNVPQGSVKVTAGGRVLTENVDYTVDYTLGRVKIINEGILNSGTPISISLENNSLFNIQTKTLMGTHVDYMASKDLVLGATIMNLTERPLTQKVNYGNEPISNTIWGLNGSYKTESMLITKLVDKLPFIDTKAPSPITVEGEFADLIPGHQRAIGKGEGGAAYIDDFEGSSSGIDMKNRGSWFLASTPQHQSDIFPEGDLTNSLIYGYNRAKLAWYVVDPLFVRNENTTPEHIADDKNQRSSNFVREVIEQEVFPAKVSPNNVTTPIALLNLSFYPDERGPYNYDVEGVNGVSDGIDSAGLLKFPETRWGGIMRNIVSTDFDATNVEYIEFWMMDPFYKEDGLTPYPEHDGGYLYFNLGDISEDVLKDSRKAFENGLPTSADVINVDTTIWGRVPVMQSLVNAFDNDPNARPYQDVGYDGLSDADEVAFFQNTYLERIVNYLGSGTQAYANAATDPSADDYHYYLGDDFDNQYIPILERYKRFNSPDGNSPSSEYYKNLNSGGYPTLETTLPNVEDINRDNTLSESERYYQYAIQLHPDHMNIGENYITDIRTKEGLELVNGNTENVRWYQFKIPVRNPDKVVGNIQDFTSIRFMRMFLRDFKDPIHLRFATLELVRGEWRKYNYSLLSPGEYIPNDNPESTFDVSAVNIEENGEKYPIPYINPVPREIAVGTTNQQALNEQSLSLKVCNLEDGDARAVYKTCDFDVRQYKRLKMFVHEEASVDESKLKDGDLTIFIRVGTDFTDNYYEYEIPMTPTTWGSTDSASIWLQNNRFDIKFSELTETKKLRNMAKEAGEIQNYSVPYIRLLDVNGKTNKITVVGTPNLNNVKTIMIGIRNPKKKLISDLDDGEPSALKYGLMNYALLILMKKEDGLPQLRLTRHLQTLEMSPSQV